MATYVDSGMLAHQASEEEIHDLMLKKAHELFAVCDKENKGFITKRDMQRLQQELPLSPEQLEDVFDSLDDDGNGFLTLEEFSEGFGGFIGLGQTTLEKQISLESSGSAGQEHVYENERGPDSADEEEHFQEMMDTIGVHTVMDDAVTLKALWSRLREDDSELLGHFETFLSRVTSELKQTHQEHQSLESALRSKSSAHDDEVRKLYEEMETQIKLERDRVLAEERAKERQLRDELEKDIYEKDRQLQELMQTHSDMEQKLEVLNSTEVETKMENEKLGREKMDMEDMLCQSQRNLDDSKAYINQLRQQYRSEKKERAMAALQISEGIALERESLVKQLEMLRDMNKKLRDDRDEADLRRGNGNLQHEISEAMLNGELKAAQQQNTSQSQDNDNRRNDEADGAPVSQEVQALNQKQSSVDKPSLRNKRGASLEKQGSILSNYFSPDVGRDASILESDDDIECDLPDMPTNQDAGGMPLTNGHVADTSFTREKILMQLESSTNPESGYELSSANAFTFDPSLASAIDQSQHELLQTSSSKTVHLSANQGEPGLSLAQELGLAHDTSSAQKSYHQRSIHSLAGDHPLSANDNPDLVSATDISLSHDEYLSPGNRSYQGSRSPKNSRSAHSMGHSAESAILEAARQKQQGHGSYIVGNGGLAGIDDGVEFDIQSPRGAPVGANSSSEPSEYASLTQKSSEESDSEVSPKPLYASVSTMTQAKFKEIESASPERLFKVVFVGDSGVGKSSFIHQFCSRTFKATFSATIGVDFQVKNMKVDGKIIALQLWDTAGQERFRSITKQYFRKADGVLVMYDVTSELSFKNVRNWMSSVQDGTEDDTVLTMVGNKMDLVDDDDRRVVTTKDGSKLADEYGALFYETSAKSGMNVVEAVQGMASLLREREDHQLQKALNLTEPVEEKRKCCA